ncbi:MAG TPA: hypothetical protein PL029_06070 [Bacteroidia bacterium]|nr:hypothetical protein [Bacteroidia bacterium]
MPNDRITENDSNSLQKGRNFSAKNVENLVEMGNAQNRQILYNIGLSASTNVLVLHF